MSRRKRSQWFSGVFSRARRRTEQGPSAPRGDRRLRFEALEDRRLLAVFSVTNLDGAGTGSLHQAVLDANNSPGADEIVFSSLFDSPQQIVFTEPWQTQFTLTDSATTTITGPGAHLLTINAFGRSRVFEVAAGASAAISGLTMTGGRAFDGGGLRNAGTVELTGVAVDKNLAAAEFGGNGEGGGLYNYFNSTMTIVDSTISNNGWPGPGAYDSVENQFVIARTGGGVQNFGTLTMINTTVSGNAAYEGAGVNNGDLFSMAGATATIINSTISHNRSLEGGFGAGVVNWAPFGSTLTMYNSIVVGNYVAAVPSDLENPVFPGDPTNFVGSHNLIGEDAKIGALAYYGGPTQTMMPAPDSPALGAGSASVPHYRATDQAGKARAAQPTIGAIEGDYDLTVTTTADISGAPSELSLQEAVQRANVIPGENTIQFSSLFDVPQTIHQRTPIFVTDPAATTINGQDRLTIEGHGGFYIKYGGLNLSGVTLTKGSLQLQNYDGNVVLSNAIVTNNKLSLLSLSNSHNGLYQVLDVIKNGGRDPYALYMYGPSYEVDPFTGLIVERGHGGTMTLAGVAVTDNEGQPGTFGSVVRNYGDEDYLQNPFYFTDSSLTITDCLFADNNANLVPSPGNFGSASGVVWNSHLLTMSRTTFRDNFSGGLGGGLYTEWMATLTDCTFSGNLAGTVGGAVANGRHATLTMTNCTLTDNVAGYPAIQGKPLYVPDPNGDVDPIGRTYSQVNTPGGGGLYNAGWATLINCTVADNAAVQPFGGSYVHGGGLLNMAWVTLDHTIIAGNTSPIYDNTEDPEAWVLPIGHDLGAYDSRIPAEEQYVSLGYNLIGVSDNSTGWIATDLTGTSETPLDPLLAPLADNGGPTETRLPLPGSPLIDAGDPDFAPPPEFDQRGIGFPRVVGTRIDIGAVEAPPLPPPSADFDGDGDVDGRDFLAWQRGYGKTGSEATHASGNANYDNIVDGADLAVWQNQYGAPPPLVATDGRDVSALSEINWGAVNVSDRSPIAGTRVARSGLLLAQREATSADVTVFEDSYVEEVDRVFEQLASTPSGVRSFGEMVARRGVKRIAVLQLAE